jgi:hypothetical protein
MLRSANVAQAAKPADEAKPRPIRKKRTPGGVRQAKQAWQPALREVRLPSLPRPNQQSNCHRKQAPKGRSVLSIINRAPIGATICLSEKFAFAE